MEYHKDGGMYDVRTLRVSEVYSMANNGVDSDGFKVENAVEK
jgi:hypothetical protein